MKRQRLITIIVIILVFFTTLFFTLKLNLVGNFFDKISASVAQNASSKFHILYVDDQYHDKDNNKCGEKYPADSTSAESIVIESNGRYGLIDTGNPNNSPEPYNANDACFNGITVANYLTSIGVSKLDFLIITHAHSDHCGGVPYLASHGFIDSNTAYIYRENTAKTSVEVNTYHTDWYHNRAKEFVTASNVNAKMVEISDHSTSNLRKINSTASFVSNGGNADYITFTFGEYNIKIYNLRYYAESEQQDKRCLIVLLTKGNQKALFMSEARNNYNLVNDIIDDIGHVDFAKIGHYDGNTGSIPLHFLNVASPDKAVMTGSLTRGKTYKNDVGYTISYFSENGGLLIGNEDYTNPIVGTFETNEIKLYTNDNGTYNPITSINITTKPKVGWYTISDTKAYEQTSDGVYLYIDSNLRMAKGLKLIGGKYYYFQETSNENISAGVMVANTWKKINGEWYYFESDGAAAIGWKQLDYNGTNYWFYFSNEGVMVTGFQKIDGKYYYFAKKTANGFVQGSMLYNTSITIDDRTFNFDENGKCTNPDPIIYTIKFDKNDSYATGTMDDLLRTYNVSANIPENGFSLSGYKLNSWNTKTDGTGTSYSPGQQIGNLSSVLGGVIILYAQWEPISYTIVFNSNASDATGTMDMVIQKRYNEPINAPANAFSRPNYTFIGWNTRADGTGTAIKNKGLMGNLTRKDGATVTLYAQWSSKPSPELQLSEETGTMTYDSPKELTITTLSNGELSCESTDTSIATCSINNKTLTITPKALNSDNQEVVVTVRQAETSGYASATESYIGVVNRKTLTCPSSTNKIYTGSTQNSDITCPNGSNTSGTTTGIDANDYVQTCTSKAGYRFEDTCDVTWRIDPKNIVVTAKPQTIVYGSTISKKLSDVTVNGLISGDNLTRITLTQNNDKIIVSGAKIENSSNVTNNYEIDYVSGNLTIEKKTITAVVTCNNKEYDKTKDADCTINLQGVIEGDSLTVNGTCKFNDASVGNNKVVTCSNITLTGDNQDNYYIESSKTTTANITPKTLEATVSASNKEYDGTLVAECSNTVDITGVIEGDIVTAQTSGSGTFDTKDVGTNKTVTCTGITLTGNDKNNYTVASSQTTKANITAKSLLVTVSASNKQYDGTDSATCSSQVTLTGILGEDKVNASVNTSGKFNDASVGTNKTVTCSNITLTGDDKNNYTVANSATTNKNITPKEVTPKILNCTNKEYDGNVATVCTYSSVEEKVGNEDVFIDSGLCMFDTKNIGTDKTVTCTNMLLEGTNKDNYVLKSTTATSKANITPKALTVTVSASNKDYDGNTSAVCSKIVDITGVIEGDTVTAQASGSGTFNTKQAGKNKTVTCTGITLSGSDRNNYTLETTQTTTANITPKALTVTVSASDKQYDGTDDAVCNGQATLTGIIGEDKVSASVNELGKFNDASVGNNKIVTCSDITLTGDDKDNYSVSSSKNTTANITKKELIATVSASNKDYDGTLVAECSKTVNITGVIEGDIVTAQASGSGTFDTKNAGTNKTVTCTGITLDGDNKYNYVISSSQNTIANIIPKTLEVTVSASDKQYDGIDNATCSSKATLTGILGEDKVSASVNTSGKFNDASVGENKIVTCSNITLTGDDKNNYTVASSKTTKANITKKKITPALSGCSNKEYDGATNTSCTLSNLTGIVEGETVNVNLGACTFNAKDIGTNKTVTCSNVTLEGTNKDNYELTVQSLTKIANITKKELTPVIENCSNKRYDGTTNASCTLSTLTGIVGEEKVSANLGTCTFDTKNAATNKTVTCTGITLDGEDKANYILKTNNVSSTAKITKKVLTATVSASDKQYDGTDSATCSSQVTLTGILGEDKVSASVNELGKFSDAAVGENKTVTCTDITLTGDDKDNYAVESSKTTTANITQKKVTPKISSCSNREYDGNKAATCTYSDVEEKIANEEVSLGSGLCTFDNKNAGDEKTVTCSNIQLEGTNKDNYALKSTTATSKANITPKALTVTWTNLGPFTYNGSKQGPTAAVLTNVDDEIIQISYNKATSAGTYVSTVNCNSVSNSSCDNYQLNNNEKEFIIKPQLVNPITNISVSTSGKVKWDNSNNATSYQICIKENNDECLTTDWLEAENNNNYLNKIVSTSVDKVIYVRAINSDKNNYINTDDSVNYSYSENVQILVPINKVTINTNNSEYGLVSKSSINVINGTLYKTDSNNLNIKSGETVLEKITTSSKEKIGYTISFDGWSKEEGTINKNITITANYSAKLIDYSINYNLAGGSTSKNNPAKYNIETNTFTLNNPTREGYEFEGWIGSNGNTAQMSVSIEKGSTGDKTYTATWKKIATSDLDIRNNIVVFEPGYTVDTVKEMVGNNNVVLRDDKGNIKESTSKLGTGNTLTIGDTTYTLSVKGDLSGDGKTEFEDVFSSYYYFKNSNQLNDIYRYAADFNGDNLVEFEDVFSMYHLFKNSTN